MHVRGYGKYGCTASKLLLHTTGWREKKKMICGISSLIRRKSVLRKLLHWFSVTSDTEEVKVYEVHIYFSIAIPRQVGSWVTEDRVLTFLAA